MMCRYLAVIRREKEEVMSVTTTRTNRSAYLVHSGPQSVCDGQQESGVHAVKVVLQWVTLVHFVCLGKVQSHRSVILQWVTLVYFICLGKVQSHRSVSYSSESPWFTSFVWAKYNHTGQSCTPVSHPSLPVCLGKVKSHRSKLYSSESPQFTCLSGKVKSHRSKSCSSESPWFISFVWAKYNHTGPSQQKSSQWATRGGGGVCQWNTNFFKMKACLERDKGSKNIPALLVCSFLLRQFCFQEAVTQWPQPLGCTVHSTASVDDGNKQKSINWSFNNPIYINLIYPSPSSWPIRALPCVPELLSLCPSHLPLTFILTSQGPTLEICSCSVLATMLHRRQRTSALDMNWALRSNRSPTHWQNSSTPVGWAVPQRTSVENSVMKLKSY